MDMEYDDWYTNEDTGTHCFDLDVNPDRQLCILLKSDGSACFAVYADGAVSCGKATDPAFLDALRALTAPSRAIACL